MALLPRNVRALVEEQVRRWHLDRAKGPKRPTRAAEPWPIITVSREFGSLGAEIGSRVAQRFGFQFWGQELVKAVAERTGMRKALVASLDETDRSGLDDFVASLFTGPGGTSAEYARQLGLVIQTIQRHGAAVIIGRGAQFLCEPHRTLRVRVVSPYPTRATGYAERKGISESRARKEVSRVDHMREAFYRKHWGCDVADASHYDLVVNSGLLSLDAACDTLVCAYRAKFGRAPKR